MSPLRSILRRIGVSVLAGSLVVPVVAGVAAADIPEAQAVPPDVPPSHAATTTAVNTMTFNGRGWGHGRGMSQYGAQGYATLFGWTSAQILDHFYGGTTAGQAAGAGNLSVDLDAVRIRLMALNGKPTVLQVANGATLRLEELPLDGSSPAAVTDPGDLTAVRLTATQSAGLLVERASSCAGPWQVVGADGLSGKSQITVSVVQQGGSAEKVQVCRDDNDNGIVDTIVWYAGKVRAVALDLDPNPDMGVVQRTVDITGIEEQLRSVVPRESPASWTQAALGAQAVAARSYALAGDSRHGWNGVTYADTCDSTLCQVYGGHAVLAASDTGGASPVSAALDGSVAPRSQTHPNSDMAIRATAGVVRLTSSNAIARTEFHSTSGGYTAGGTFPAVPDDGDQISPLHTWTRTVAVTALESTYGDGGTLVDIEVTGRNGLGADGGRVTDTILRFSNGVTAQVSGNTVRSKIGLLSDWFKPTCPLETRYLNAVYQLFVNRAATADEVERWCGPVRRGERKDLTEELSVSDEWAGVQIGGLYVKILGREAEDSGRAFWLDQVVHGMRIEEIAAEFYGSAEYYSDHGTTSQGYVSGLYTDLLGRDADDDGLAFWVKVLDNKVRTRTGVADEFYDSIESRSDRVDDLYQQILERGAEPGGRSFWAEQLRTLGDVALAAELAASDEYFARATQTAS